MDFTFFFLRLLQIFAYHLCTI